MTYGIKKQGTATVYILTNSNEFLCHKFVGIGGVAPKEWKTREGASKVAQKRQGAEVFPIDENGVMAY